MINLFQLVILQTFKTTECLGFLGTIQTLYFVEVINGNNVSIANVTVPFAIETHNFSVNLLFTEVS
jgi:hypothetical protein